MVVSPILYDFYNYGPEDRQFSLLLAEFLQVLSKTHLSSFSFAFALTIKNGPLMAYCNVLSQSVALLGALLFFIGMKNSRTTWKATGTASGQFPYFPPPRIDHLAGRITVVRHSTG